MTDFDFIPIERIEHRIYFLRGCKVMLDGDLADLYGVSTKVLNQSVRRNFQRFPEDFMFQLTKNEYENLRSQFVTSSSGWGGHRYLPYVFTEQGIAMLSSVLKSERAILVNIQIIRTFSKLRELATNNEYLRQKIEYLEKQYDEQFQMVFESIRKLLVEEDKPKVDMGFQDR